MITAMDPHMESEAVIIPVIATMIKWVVDNIVEVMVYVSSVYCTLKRLFRRMSKMVEL